MMSKVDFTLEQALICSTTIHKVTRLDDEHPDRPPGVEQVHGVLVELVQVERVDALLGAHQDVLVVRLRVDPRRSAVDPQGATVENLEKRKLENQWDSLSDSDF